MRRLLFHRFASSSGERVIFRAAIVLTNRPFGADPAVLFELVESRIERSLADLENLGGHLMNALCNCPTVHRFQRKCLQNQKI